MVAWKIHDLKSNIANKMDDVAFKDDPHNKPNYKHQNHHSNNHHHKKKWISKQYVFVYWSIVIILSI